MLKNSNYVIEENNIMSSIQNFKNTEMMIDRMTTNNQKEKIFSHPPVQQYQDFSQSQQQMYMEPNNIKFPVPVEDAIKARVNKALDEKNIPLAIDVYHYIQINLEEEVTNIFIKMIKKMIETKSLKYEYELDLETSKKLLQYDPILFNSVIGLIRNVGYTVEIRRKEEYTTFILSIENII